MTLYTLRSHGTLQLTSFNYQTTPAPHTHTKKDNCTDHFCNLIGEPCGKIKKEIEAYLTLGDKGRTIKPYNMSN